MAIEKKHSTRVPLEPLVTPDGEPAFFDVYVKQAIGRVVFDDTDFGQTATAAAMKTIAANLDLGPDVGFELSRQASYDFTIQGIDYQIDVSVRDNR